MMTTLSNPSPAPVDGDGAPPGKIRDILKKGEASAFERYRALTFPTGSVLTFWLFELASILLLP